MNRTSPATPSPTDQHFRGATRNPTRFPLRACLVALLGFLVASAASAGYFMITLTNGTSLQSRYRPAVADWDDSVALIRTDQGNWIAIAKNEIADVVSQAEISGFGYQLDTTTLFVGWSPNDLVDAEEGDDDEDGGGGRGGGGDGDGEDKPYYQDESYYDSPAEDTGFSLEQFVDVPTEGESIGAIDTGPAVSGRDDG